MFRVKRLVACGSIALLAGCAAPQTAVRLETVGPAPGGFRGGPQGWLQVYTSTEPKFSNGSWHFPHTPYSVYDTSGARALSVSNRAGETDPVPAIASLPPGDYVVYAQAEGYGRIAVPIVIQRGRLTPIHLERAGLPQTASIPATNLVHLPDGPPVGFRAGLKE